MSWLRNSSSKTRISSSYLYITRCLSRSQLKMTKFHKWCNTFLAANQASKISRSFFQINWLIFCGLKFTCNRMITCWRLRCWAAPTTKVNSRRTSNLFNKKTIVIRFIIFWWNNPAPTNKRWNSILKVKQWN